MGICCFMLSVDYFPSVATELYFIISSKDGNFLCELLVEGQNCPIWEVNKLGTCQHQRKISLLMMFLEIVDKGAWVNSIKQ